MEGRPSYSEDKQADAAPASALRSEGQTPRSKHHQGQASLPSGLSVGAPGGVTRRSKSTNTQTPASRSCVTGVGWPPGPMVLRGGQDSDAQLGFPGGGRWATHQ